MAIAQMTCGPYIFASDAEAIVTSDVESGDQGPYSRIYVGVAGDVSLVTLAGNTVVFKAVPVGILNVGTTRVTTTNTTATNMVGLV